jgi:hypothetical protein
MLSVTGRNMFMFPHNKNRPLIIYGLKYYTYTQQWYHYFYSQIKKTYTLRYCNNAKQFNNSITLFPENRPPVIHALRYHNYA